MTGLTIFPSSTELNINRTATAMETELPFVSANVAHNITEVAQGILTRNSYSLDEESQNRVLIRPRLLMDERLCRIEALRRAISVFNYDVQNSFSLEAVGRFESLLDHFQTSIYDLAEFNGTTERQNLLRTFRPIMQNLIAHGEVFSFEQVVTNYPFLIEAEFSIPRIREELIKTAIKRGDSDMLSVVLNNYLSSIVDLAALIRVACQRPDLVSLTNLLVIAKQKGLPIEESVVTAWPLHLLISEEAASLLLGELSSLFLTRLAKKLIESWGVIPSVDHENLLRKIFTRMQTSTNPQELDSWFRFLVLKTRANVQGLEAFIEANSFVYTELRLVDEVINFAQNGQVVELNRLLLALKRLKWNQESLNRLFESVQMIDNDAILSRVRGSLAMVFGSTVIDILISRCDFDIPLLRSLMEKVVREKWGINSERALKIIFDKIKIGEFTKNKLMEFLECVSSFCNTQRSELLSLFRLEFSEFLEVAIAQLLDKVPLDRSVFSGVVVGVPLLATGSTDSLRECTNYLRLLRHLGITSSQLEAVYKTLYEGAQEGLTIIPYWMANLLRVIFSPSEFPAMESQLAALESEHEAKILSKVSDETKQLICAARQCLDNGDLDGFKNTLKCLEQKQLSESELNSLFFCLEKMTLEAKKTVGLNIGLVTNWIQNYQAEQTLVCLIKDVARNGNLQELKKLLRHFQWRRPSQSTQDSLRSWLEQSVSETELSAVLYLWKKVFPEKAELPIGLAPVALSE